jgi:hypothetical protein
MNFLSSLTTVSFPRTTVFVRSLIRWQSDISDLFISTFYYGGYDSPMKLQLNKIDSNTTISLGILVYLVLVSLATRLDALVTYRRMMRWWLNWKGGARKWSWPKLRYYPGIWPKRLRKTKRNSQDSQPHDRYLNPGPPQYEAGVPTAQ